MSQSNRFETPEQGRAPLTLTIPEAQNQLRLSRSRVYELIRSGELPSFKIGRSRRILSASLQKFLDQKQSEGC